jgi:hypothetical protein
MKNVLFCLPELFPVTVCEPKNYFFLFSREQTSERSLKIKSSWFYRNVLAEGAVLVLFKM